MKNRREVYAGGEWRQDRHISHFAIRTMNPVAYAEFYCEVLGLQPANRGEADESHYLTDGRMTLVLMPWDIARYAGTGISRPGPDHFAFTVESIAAFRKSCEAMIERNQNLAPPGLGIGPEGRSRLALFAASTPYAQHHLADPDNVLIAVGERD